MKKVVLSLACLLAPSICLAASFDCSKATTFAEKTICGDKSLSFLDDQLTTKYTSLSNQTRQLSKQHSELLASQKKWLQTRNQCTDANCLKTAYEDRIKSLEELQTQLASKKMIKHVDATALNGDWKGSGDQHTSSLLTIKNADNNGFDFKLAATSGSNTGEIEQKATFFGKDAIFVDSNKETGCVLLFQLKPKNIVVSANDGCNTYGGIGVAFGGNFTKSTASTASASKNSTLAEYGLLKDAQQEQKFSKLTGKDYNLFVTNCGNLVSEKEQSTDPKAVYSSASARGLATIQECIIMYNENHIWAAVIDDPSKSIKYYTNDPIYRNKLPKAISDWASNINSKVSTPLKVHYQQ